jgi:hypothetical protein
MEWRRRARKKLEIRFTGPSAIDGVLSVSEMLSEDTANTPSCDASEWPVVRAAPGDTDDNDEGARPVVLLSKLVLAA